MGDQNGKWGSKFAIWGIKENADRKTGIVLKILNKITKL